MVYYGTGPGSYTHHEKCGRESLTAIQWVCLCIITTLANVAISCSYTYAHTVIWNIKSSGTTGVTDAHTVNTKSSGTTGVTDPHTVNTKSSGSNGVNLYIIIGAAAGILLHRRFECEGPRCSTVQSAEARTRACKFKPRPLITDNAFVKLMVK